MMSLGSCLRGALGCAVGLGLATAALAESPEFEERTLVFQAVADSLSDFCFDPLRVLERSAAFVPTAVRWPFERPLGAALPAADALKVAGVLAGTVGLSDVAVRVVSRVDRASEPKPVEKLVLTDSAAPYRIVNAVSERLCFARPAVASVTLRSPPVKTLMGTVMVVTYRYRVERVAPWAESETLQQAIPEIRGAFEAAGQSRQMALVQTDTGWRRAW